jgi:putative DNA primase/helicase
MVYDGQRWVPDDSGVVAAKMKITARRIHHEATEATDHQKSKTLAKHVMSSETRQRISDALYLAQSESGVPMLPSEFDSDPWLLNVENGTIDLRSGEDCEHRRGAKTTKLAPVEYDPVGAAAPTSRRSWSASCHPKGGVASASGLLPGA